MCCSIILASELAVWRCQGCVGYSVEFCLQALHTPAENQLPDVCIVVTMGNLTCLALFVVLTMVSMCFEFSVRASST